MSDPEETTPAARRGRRRVSGRADWDAVNRILELALEHLGMEIGWVSEFAEGDQVFRRVAGDEATFNLHEGDRAPLSTSFCTRVLDGRLDPIVTDARADAVTRDLPGTREVGIGSYIGVPVRFSDGHVFGMMCCLSHQADHELGPQDVRFLEVLARLAGDQVEQDAEERARIAEREHRIRAALDGTGLAAVYQPIVSLDTLDLRGAEALSRFTDGPGRPDAWFAEATSLGLGVELELTAVRTALAGLDLVPTSSYLSVNASPATASTAAFADLVTPVADRIVLEITEHVAVGDYVELGTRLAPLRDAGVRLAVDDAGAGFASLRHILQLRPDIIKIDISITRDIHRDPARAALASSLLEFGKGMGATVVAEGVEVEGELHALEALGVTAAQGYLLGRPAAVPRITLA